MCRRRMRRRPPATRSHRRRPSRSLAAASSGASEPKSWVRSQIWKDPRVPKFGRTLACPNLELPTLRRLGARELWSWCVNTWRLCLCLCLRLSGEGTLSCLSGAGLICGDADGRISFSSLSCANTSMMSGTRDVSRLSSSWSLSHMNVNYVNIMSQTASQTPCAMCLRSTWRRKDHPGGSRMFANAIKATTR